MNTTVTAIIETRKSEVATYTLKGGKVVSNPALVPVLTAMDNLNRAGQEADIMRCVLINRLRTLNAQKETKAKSIVAFCEQQYGYAKSTANTYANIGKTFFDKDGNPVIDGIVSFTTGQLIPLLALVNDYPCICGVDLNNDIMSDLIAFDFISPDMTVKEIKGIADTLKACYVPKEWVTEIDGEYVVLTKGNAVIMSFAECPYYVEEEAETAEAETTDDGETAEAGEVGTISEAIRKAFALVDGLDLDDTLRKEWKKASDNLLKVAGKIDTATHA